MMPLLCLGRENIIPEAKERTPRRSLCFSGLLSLLIIPLLELSARRWMELLVSRCVTVD